MAGLDSNYMEVALRLAERAASLGEVPVGAVVVQGDKTLGEGFNQPIVAHDPTAHAEIMAMRNAGSTLGNYRLEHCTLYVTLEPCVMCMGALLNARIARLVFGAWDPKAGACGSLLDLSRETRLNHRVDVFGGVRSEECAALLKNFFERRR
jgi:tRNA(adenine34) deaminase